MFPMSHLNSFFSTAKSYIKTTAYRYQIKKCSSVWTLFRYGTLCNVHTCLVFANTSPAFRGPEEKSPHGGLTNRPASSRHNLSSAHNGQPGTSVHNYRQLDRGLWRWDGPVVVEAPGRSPPAPSAAPVAGATPLVKDGRLGLHLLPKIQIVPVSFDQILSEMV